VSGCETGSLEGLTGSPSFQVLKCGQKYFRKNTIKSHKSAVASDLSRKFALRIKKTDTDLL